MTCLVCKDGWPRLKRYDGKFFHSLPEPCPDLICEDQSERATDQEIEDDLRDQIANGDC